MISLANLGVMEFEIYTQFFLQTTAICWYLKAEIFEEEMQKTTKSLAKQSWESLESLEKVRFQSEIISETM